MSARDHALLALDERRLPGWPSHLLRRRRPPLLDARDRALAEQLTLGVIKNVFHLEFLAAHFSGRPPGNIDALVRKILAIALYQLRFLDRIPAHAAVDEAVEQTRRLGRRRATGFVNAVLRKASAGPWPPLPDPELFPAEHARLALSHPPELFKRLSSLVGAPQALAICRHNNAEPPTIVRLNPGHSLAEIDLGGTEVHAHEQSGLYLLDPAPMPLLAELAERGIAQVQDRTAAGVVPLLQLQPGQRVLDRCCGVGTKTMQIAESVGPAGLVIAMDPATARCQALGRLVEARSARQVCVRCAGRLSELPAEDPQVFDAILVDAPCSNSGVLARRPEARFHQAGHTLLSLARLQDEILDDCAGRLAPGGRLLYSTCSVWPEENEQRIVRFLQAHPGLRLERQRTILPDTSDNPCRYHDGGYCALICSE